MRLVDANKLLEALGEFPICSSIGLDDDDNIVAEFSREAILYIAICGEEAFMKKASEQTTSQSALDLLRTLAYQMNIEKIPVIELPETGEPHDQ